MDTFPRQQRKWPFDLIVYRCLATYADLKLFLEQVFIKNATWGRISVLWRLSLTGAPID